MKFIKKSLSLLIIVSSFPFVALGFIGTFIAGSYRIGAELLDKFVEWVEDY